MRLSTRFTLRSACGKRAALFVDQSRGFLLYTGYVRNGTGLESQTHRSEKIDNTSPYSPKLRTVLQSKLLRRGSAEVTDSDAHDVGTGGDSAVQWDEKSSADVVALERRTEELSAPTSPPRPLRPYVPLGEVARVELRGDHCIEGGLFADALQHFGVVAKAFSLAYPRVHTQQAHIALKLGRAFRLTGDLASARFNVERALSILDEIEAPEVELIAETIMELGLVLRDAKDSEAPAVFMDAANVLTHFHDFGSSHRLLRLLPRATRKHHQHMEKKHWWFGLKDWDRSYAIADLALKFAEEEFRAASNLEGVVAALEVRAQFADRKFFNVRNDCGKIGISRGRWVEKAYLRGSPPTPEEILRFSPTIHQPYRDYRLENTAPLTFGPPIPVAVGSNRKVMDDGDPLRFRFSRDREYFRATNAGPAYDSTELLRW